MVQSEEIDPLEDLLIEIQDLPFQHPQMLQTHPNHKPRMLAEAMADQPSKRCAQPIFLIFKLSRY